MFLAALALCTVMLPTGPGTETQVQGQCKIEVEVETPIEQEVELAYIQVTAPNTTVQDGAGWCLRHTQSVFSSPVAFPSARAAWDGQKGRHSDRPPLGVSVPIFFDHYGSYGQPAHWDNWGHVATRLADGRVLTSPFYSNYGSEIYESIDHMAQSMPGGAKYLGWSEYMNGKQIVRYETTQGDDMPSAEEIARAIMKYPVKRQGKGLTGYTSLEGVIAYFDASRAATIDGSVKGVLDTPVKRQRSGIKGNTNLRAVIGHFDASREETIRELKKK